jgi:hypothetical protein
MTDDKSLMKTHNSTIDEARIGLEDRMEEVQIINKAR